MGQCVNCSNAEATFFQSTRRQIFWNLSIPCNVDIHWIDLTEYSLMSTDVPGFLSF